MHITEFTISTKKGESQKVRWLISQEIPYPDIEGSCGTLKWRNAGGLFPAQGRPASGIGSRFYCYLLVPEIAIPEDYNRNHFAGYVPYQSYGKPQLPPNPGTITFRGEDLGELLVYFGDNPDWPEIKSECSNHVGGAARDMLLEQVIPPLREYIKQNAAKLKSKAVEKLRKRMSDKIGEASKALSELSIEAAKAIKAL
jgi:hypothetical protein